MSRLNFLKAFSISAIALFLAGSETCQPCCENSWLDGTYQCVRYCEVGETPFSNSSNESNAEEESETQIKFAWSDLELNPVEPFSSDVPLSKFSAEDTCPGLLKGVPRGLSCLHCTQSEAEDQARKLAVLLFNSCLENVALTYLLDGSFSQNSLLLKEHIDLLSSNGRRPFIYIYLSNGAAQRQWDKTSFNTFGVQVKPEEFRERIFYDQDLRSEYKQIVRNLVPYIYYARSRGAVISLIPSLEDNLDDRSFNELLKITYDEVPKDVGVNFGRNPCPGCYSGNTSWAPSGVFIDQHTKDTNGIILNGLISNDGREYSYAAPGSQEFERQSGLTLNNLRQVRDASFDANSTFVLWSGKRQGLASYVPGTTVYPPASERVYAMPDFNEQRALLYFLREGLEP